MGRVSRCSDLKAPVGERGFVIEDWRLLKLQW
jgi:hypothetical protein